MKCDVLICGGGAGGCAAALALSDKGLKVVMTEPTAWIGGQLTSQLVPPDEHPWIQECGRTERYAQFREGVRAWYRANRALTAAAKADRLLNPGMGWVSALCHEPAVAVTVLEGMLAQARANGLEVWLDTTPVSADVEIDVVRSVTLSREGLDVLVEPRFVLDATETGDLLPLAGVEYRLGAESRAETGEPNALDGPEEAENVQGITWCAALGYDEGGDHTIAKPDQYDRWKGFTPMGWPVPLLSFQMFNAAKQEVLDFPLFGNGWFNLFGYRQIVDPALYEGPERPEPATVMNWPQNDYYLGTILDVPAALAESRLEESRQLSLSFIYWLQTEKGYPGIRLRPDLAGTRDGLAMAPYIRESRRIRALQTVKEQDVAAYTNPGLTVAPDMRASVGTGAYRIDLHPAANGTGPIDTSTLPFQIPMGSLIPVRVRNLLAAGKNIGVTHITNGCYRLHPVEWNVGESAGLLAAFCLTRSLVPAEVWESEPLASEFQNACHHEGIATRWPAFRAL